MTIAAVTVIVLLAGGIFLVVFNKAGENSDKKASLAAYVPSASNMDPSTQIPDIFAGPNPTVTNEVLSYPDYQALLHVNSTDRVAYDRFPPVGGPHDAVWAPCNGTVFSTPVRNENMVHPLEHGAIWIAYNPATIAAGDLDILKGLVENKSFMVLSPYTDLDRPISLQAWAHQLKLDSASDPRIEQFITALRTNQYVTPELGATCDQPTFNTVSPPPLDTAAPDAATAIPLDGEGLTEATDEMPAVDTGSVDLGSLTEGVDPSGAVTSGAETSGAETSGAETSGAETSGADPSAAASSEPAASEAETTESAPTS